MGLRYEIIMFMGTVQKWCLLSILVMQFEADKRDRVTDSNKTWFAGKRTANIPLNEIVINFKCDR